MGGLKVNIVFQASLELTKTHLPLPPKCWDLACSSSFLGWNLLRESHVASLCEPTENVVVPVISLSLHPYTLHESTDRHVPYAWLGFFFK